MSMAETYRLWIGVGRIPGIKGGLQYFWERKEKQQSTLLITQSRGAATSGQTWLAERRYLHPFLVFGSKGGEYISTSHFLA